MAADRQAGGGKHSRLRRARKDWIKGDRERVSRIEADDESVAGGQEAMRPRVITIDDVGSSQDLPRGQVILSESGRYEVRMDDSATMLSCQVKRGASTANELSTLVVIGDFVRVQTLEDGRGLISHVEERRSRLGRTAAGRKGMEQVVAANVDVILCTIGADRPDFRRTIIDRYIVASLLGDAEPIIVVNKIDTLDAVLDELVHEEMAIYDDLGYSMHFVSAETRAGLDELRESIGARTAVLVGQSGAGKSTITNALIGDESRRTGEVREKDRRGVHTTVDSIMLSLDGGGHLIDTPGLREFGIWDLEPEELDGYFVEFEDFLQQCRYLPCTHTHEPACAVRAAVENGSIDEGRFASYLSIFESLKQQ
ncbi:MAG: ribosome small subunit-dependent GTPase A [bacterium]|nr:ribosome small subunit-dependent GTPase A [Candidatus Kapabacteria bacterium]